MSPAVDARRVGVIGLGAIGGGVARSLARAGRPVTVYDLLPEARDPFAGIAAIAGSPAEVAAACDVVLVAVVTAGQVEAVLAGEGGIFSAGRIGQVVVVQSTVSVRRLLEFVEQGRAHGITVIDGSVTGGREGAEAGRLVTMVGASDADFERVRPVLEDFTALALHFGPPGAGIRAKLTRNITSHVMIAAAAEAGRLALAAGVDVAKLQQAMRVSDESTGGISGFFGRMTDGTYHGPTAGAHRRARATAGLARKDLQAGLELAAELGVDLPVARFVEARVDSTFDLDRER